MTSSAGAALLLVGWVSIVSMVPGRAAGASQADAPARQGDSVPAKTNAEQPSKTDRNELDRLAVGHTSLTAAAINGSSFTEPVAEEEAVSAVLVRAEVLLDRAHASPGVIDGKNGPNFKNAVSMFELMHDLPVDGRLSRQVWSALTKDDRPAVALYTITTDDAGYQFTPNIPTDYGQMSKLPALNYRNAFEMFAERFHMNEDLLQILNPGVDMTKAGHTIEVAQIVASPLEGKIVRIDVDKAKGQVRAYGDDGKLIVAYPATVGSEELPSPSGTHKVKGVARHPVYSYDPKKNFQQGDNTKPLTIPAGPNNPVGAVYIALSKPTYGIHGTPDPSKIDKTSSHGCVRLTNWDAQELAGAVRPGVVVHFLGSKGG
jgi:lipoprotein-anchoring transpeptidase ErfK/SrfK